MNTKYMNNINKVVRIKDRVQLEGGSYEQRIKLAYLYGIATALIIVDLLLTYISISGS